MAGDPQMLNGRLNVLPRFLEVLRDEGPTEAMALPRAGQAKRCGQYIANCTQQDRQEWLERLLDLPTASLRANIHNRVVTHREINRIVAENRVRLKRPLSVDREGTVHP